MASLTTTRPAAATVLAALQTAIALANIGLAVIVLLALRSPMVASHAKEAVHAVMLNTVMVMVAAVATSVAAIGLWKRWAAGWALTLALGLTVVLGMLWGPVFDHDHMEPDDIAVTAAFIATIVLALLRSVLRWYLGPRSATTLPPGSDKMTTGY
jgi:Na+/proline symporter